MSNEESRKNAKGNKDSGVVMDINGDLQNFDTQHNSGDSGIVVMKGGKPELYGRASNAPRGVPTKEELEAKEDDGIQSTTRVTALPDAMDGEGEEVVVPPVSVKKESPKQVTRIDMNSNDIAPPTEKRKRGRPRKS